MRNASIFIRIACKKTAIRVLRPVWKIASSLGFTKKYRCGDFYIKLPAESPLPAYQGIHKLLDRFLPHLCTYIEQGSTVIDVGANCGDTFAAMISANPGLRFVCVEAHEPFYNILLENISQIKSDRRHSSIKVEAVNCLIGKHTTGVTLTGTNGSRRALFSIDDTSLKSRTLDDVLSEFQISNVRLLKSDVDGFDYDVLDSAQAVIAADAPLIYFECQTDDPPQMAGFKKTCYSLASRGYDNWSLFDNFGEFMLTIRDQRQLHELLEYIWRQNVGRTTRTIHYFDILAYQDKDVPLVENVIRDYCSDAPSVARLRA